LQTATVVPMCSAIDEMVRTVRGVSESATCADALARQIAQLAQQGGTTVQRSTEVREAIRAISSQSVEIIQVVAAIASQTNRLSLNAAIEAARTGQHDMGFAVVADEVRKLAERSNQAAREIAALIKESVPRVEQRVQCSEETSIVLHQIMQGVDATATKIAGIINASVQQARHAEAVATAIQQVSKIAEEAAGSSEELAANSEELGQQAVALKGIVGRFKTTAV
jgi:methyl-accepting chemotaxis protein